MPEGKKKHSKLPRAPESYIEAYLAVRANLRLTLAILLGSNGPVNEEHINVVKSKTLQRVVNGPEDVLITVEVVPHLGADEDVLTLHGGVLLQEVTDTLTNLTLVQVVPGTVQVTVTGLQGSGDSSIGLALGTLTSEGTKADARNLDAVAQCESLSVGHDDESIGMN